MAIGDAGLGVRVEPAISINPLRTFLSRYFYLCMALVMAALVLAGFSRTVDANLIHAAPPRPLLLWVHGAAFSAWIVFFVLQSALVRVRKVRVHRSLGWFGAGLAAVMAPLGIAIAIIMTRFDTVVLHQQGVDGFLGIPFLDMIVFGLCVGLAITWRTRPEYHRRLLFIATCHLMDAAIGRFDFFFNHCLFFPALDVLIVLGMLRDWMLDGRAHKVYLYALPPILAGQAVVVYLWRTNPAWWQGITHPILGL